MVPAIRRSCWHSIVEWSLVCLVLVLVITLVHGASVWTNWSQMHWEDPLFIHHVGKHVDALPSCLIAPSLWPGLYRPLSTNCYYFLGGQFFAHQIEWYHAINVLLYGLNALLLYWFVRQLLSFPFALLAMALFASRRAHVEVVTNTAEFQILAATCFALTALILFVLALRHNRRYLLLLVYLILLLVILSKEATTAVTAMLPVLVWLFYRPSQRRFLLLSWASVVGTALFVWTMIRHFTDYQPTGFTFTTMPTRVWRNIIVHFWSFANPLAHDESELIMPQAVETMATSLLGQAIVAFFLVATVVLCVFNRSLSDAGRVSVMGALFFLVAILPYSFFNDRLFMRYGYFAHAGLASTIAAAVAWGLSALRMFGQRFTSISPAARLSGTGLMWFRDSDTDASKSS